MFNYSSNGIRQLTDEQRKALAQCLAFGARPAEILFHTKYVTLEPNGDLSLTAEAAQDWMLLHQQSFHVDELTGEIIERHNLEFVSPNGREDLGLEHGCFTADQERRIREIIGEVLRPAIKTLLDFLA